MAANYVLLEKIVVGAAGASSVTFSSIPQTGYTDLVVKVSVRSNRVNASDGMNLQFNADTANNYSTRRIYGVGSGTPTSDSLTPYARIFLNDIPGSTATASTFCNTEVYVPNYLLANQKSVSADTTFENNTTAAGLVLLAGIWTGTAAITSIKLYPDGGTLFVQYSTFSLYGVSALGTTPTKAPKALGGDIIETDGTYWYHAFLASGTFTPATTLSCDYLVVAGGGGGGGSMGGGGGAGGLLNGTLGVSTAATVTVGAGGGGGASTVIGVSGSNSVFSSVTATGGGGGGGFSAGPAKGADGGSGGGSTYTATASAASPAGQGNAGGAGGYDGGGGIAGGGGGGAGAAGTAGNTLNVAGGGGNGVNTYSAWATATATGASGYYAGGGGGASNSGGPGGGTSGTGGSGGGAAGNKAGIGNAATVNTGGGGGGGGNGSAGGAGASGIVIVRYAV